jgi:hypothetical protein
MADVVTTKFFRNGGSIALRIPAGWFDPEQDITLVRDSRTGRVYLNQGDAFDPEDFFDFMRGKPYLLDPALQELSVRRDPPRPSPLDHEEGE